MFARSQEGNTSSQSNRFKVRENCGHKPDLGSRMGSISHRLVKSKYGPYLDRRNRNTTWVKVLNPNYSQRAGRAELFKKRYAAASGA
jgi:hypothetical protein